MRTLLVFGAFAIALYIGFSLMLYLLQERMVFLPHMPGRSLDATPETAGLAYEDAWIETEDGERLHGWFVPADNARGTLLFFHGNAGNISHRLESLMIFNRLGLDVLIVDYRGYGQSSGKASEEGTYRDARAAWNYLLSERQVPAGRIVIFGRSLGGAVGAWLASQPDVEPAGIVIESTFSSGLDMGKRLYPVLPVRLTFTRDSPTERASSMRKWTLTMGAKFCGTCNSAISSAASALEMCPPGPRMRRLRCSGYHPRASMDGS